MLNHVQGSLWLLHNKKVIITINPYLVLVVLLKEQEADQVTTHWTHIQMELQVLVNSQEAIPPHMLGKDFQWSAKLRILMTIVLFFTKEVNSSAVVIISLKSQQITPTYSLLLSMLNHQKVSSLNYQRRKLKTFWRNSRMTTNRWPLHYRLWISVLFFWILNSFNRDDLELHQQTLEVDLKWNKKKDSLRMHHRVRNKRSRTYKSKMKLSSKKPCSNKR